MSPQQYAVLSAVRPQACQEPTLSALSFSPPDTRTGTVLHRSPLHTSEPPEPMPSCPKELSPQQYAALSAVTPHADMIPVPMLTNVRPPVTAVGVRVLVSDPLPSPPYVSSPQQ